MTWKIIVQLTICCNNKDQKQSKGQDPGVFHVDPCSTMNFKICFTSDTAGNKIGEHGKGIYPAKVA